MTVTAAGAPTVAAGQGIDTAKVVSTVNNAAQKTQGFLESLQKKVEVFCEKVKTNLFDDNFNSNVKPKIDTIARLLIPTVCGMIASPGLFVIGTVFSFAVSLLCEDTVKKIVNKLKETWNLTGMSEAPYQMVKIPLYFLMPTITSAFLALEVGHQGKIALEGKAAPAA